MPVRKYDPTLDVGDRVWAWWNSKQSDFYIGEILKLGGFGRDAKGRDQVTDFVIRFADGAEQFVPPDLLQRFSLTAGLPIECRFDGQDAFKPCVVVAAEQEQARVRTPDGQERTVSFADIRIQGRSLPPQDS